MTGKIYCYKMTTDSGGAPCVEAGLLSLAICKPQVRKGCSKGDHVIGFGGKDLGERLIYVAKVTEVKADGTYYGRDASVSPESSRADCIYQWDNERKQYEIKSGAKYHGKGDQLEHDLGVRPEYAGDRVLLSDKFAYYGKSGTADYKEKFSSIKELVEKMTQGHRVNYTDELLGDLGRLINEALVAPAKPGKPTHGQDCGRVCGGEEQGSRDVVVENGSAKCV